MAENDKQLIQAVERVLSMGIELTERSMKRYREAVQRAADNGEIMPKTDCFAYNRDNGGCNVLKGLYCSSENCKFYKKKEQFEREARMLEKKRIRS